MNHNQINTNLVLTWLLINTKLVAFKSLAKLKMIILFGGQKGGSAKTTSAINTASYLAQKGHDVIIVDADTQASSAKWIADRDETDLPSIHCVRQYGDVKKTLRDLNKRYDYVLVDVAGKDSTELRTAMLVADTMIVPFIPSQLDLDTLDKVALIVQDAMTFNENLKTYCLLSSVSTHAKSKEIPEAHTYIANFPIITPLQSVIYQRMIYRSVIATGHGVVEAKDNKAIQDFNAVMHELGL